MPKIKMIVRFCLKIVRQNERAEEELNMPLWARLPDGPYLAEEVEGVLPKYRSEVVRLADLWMERNQSSKDVRIN